MIIETPREFYNLTPSQRYAVLQKTKNKIILNTKKITPPFSIVATGSACYGFNPKSFGNLDDIDLFCIIPDTLAYGKFISLLYHNGKSAIFDLLEKPSEIEYLDVLSNKIQILSIYSLTNGIRSGSHVMRECVLKECIQKNNLPIRTLVKDKPNIQDDISIWSTFLINFVPFLLIEDNCSEEKLYQNFILFKKALVKLQNINKFFSGYSYNAAEEDSKFENMIGKFIQEINYSLDKLDGRNAFNIFYNLIFNELSSKAIPAIKNGGNFVIKKTLAEINEIGKFFFKDHI